MAKYIHLLKTEQSFIDKYYGEEYLEPWVSLTDTENAHVNYNKRMATVDLGLPSGNLWAAYNLGASSSAESGDFYAWAELEPKTSYLEETYKYYDSQTGDFTKYFSGDSNRALLPEDDAATVKLGGGWQVPTKEDFDELIENCNYTSYTEGDFTYLKLTSNINGKSIVFLNTGAKIDSGVTSSEYFYLWAANDLYDQCTSPTYNRANILRGSAMYPGLEINVYNRVYGLQIRPVLKTGNQ